jgi:TolB protein
VKRLAAAIVIFVAMVANTTAELTIEITRGRDNPTAIAVVPFAWSGPGVLSEDISAIITADLHRSGQFQPLATADMLATPHRQSEVYYRDWRVLGMEYLVIGRIRRDNNAKPIELQVELFDILKQERIFQESVRGGENQLRDIAHYVSDRIYEKLTGIPGAFSTKILYVSAKNFSANKQNFRLIKADADGAREQLILESSEPILSPSWSPDGKQIAYVSFESSRPAIYRQVLATGEREKLTGFRGLNSAPAWSPDGRRLAMVLSKDGNPEIYMMEMATRKLTRLTNHFAIDTEPSWSADGKSLIFTSNRGGKPQIYQLTLATGWVERLTFEGDYNARARALADGSGVVMVHRAHSGGPFNIAFQHLESPTVAPNGSMIMYATRWRGKGILAAVSIDGNVKYHLPSAFRDVREPAWSPALK